MTAPTTRETAYHAELARLAEDASSAPWSVDADDIGRTIVASPVEIVARDTRHNSEFIAAANPATVLALLSEIAALRGERDGLKNRVSCLERLGGEQSTRVMEQATRAKDAERQRDELRKAMPDLSSVIAWLDNGCEPKHAVTELGIYKARIDKAIANQGADQ